MPVSAWRGRRRGRIPPGRDGRSGVRKLIPSVAAPSSGSVPVGVGTRADRSRRRDVRSRSGGAVASDRHGISNGSNHGRVFRKSRRGVARSRRGCFGFKPAADDSARCVMVGWGTRAVGMDGSGLPPRPEPRGHRRPPSAAAGNRRGRRFADALASGTVRVCDRPNSPVNGGRS